MQTARVTARQVAESMSVEELRAAAKELPEHSEVKFVAEDIAQLLEYIADLREPDTICPHCGWDYREARNE